VAGAKAVNSEAAGPRLQLNFEQQKLLPMRLAVCLGEVKIGWGLVLSVIVSWFKVQFFSGLKSLPIIPPCEITPFL
jgi:hypothetical protein